MTDDPLEQAGTPHCPVHLEPLQVFGDDAEGRDARWMCVVPGCTWVRVS